MSLELTLGLTALVVVVFLTAGLLLARRRRPPASHGEGQSVERPTGLAPDLHGVPTPAKGERSRVADIIETMRWRAANQLIDHLGAAFVPDAMRTLVEELGDPGEAVNEFIRLLGEDPKAVASDIGDTRRAFLDKLDAFSLLEAQLRDIDANASRRIFMLLREGHSTEVRQWATAAKRVRECGALLEQVDVTTPAKIALTGKLKDDQQALSRRVLVLLPPDLPEIIAAIDNLLPRATALLRFAEEWDALDQQRVLICNRIDEGWDLGDPVCASQLAPISAIDAQTTDTWKQITAFPGASVAALRGLLDDLERQNVALEAIAAALAAHYATRDHDPGGATGADPGYDPSGRPKSSRAHSDPYHHVWEFFGFTSRPTLEECKRARAAMVKVFHPDVPGTGDHAKMLQIDDNWTLARTVLEGIKV